MNLKERIIKELKVQKDIEGDACQDKLLLKYLNAVRTDSQWNAMVICRYYSYGTLSYETHRFYYPSKELLDFLESYNRKDG